MEKIDLRQKIIQFLKKYSNGISLTPLEAVSLFIIKLSSSENFEKNYIDKDTVINAIVQAKNLLGELDLYTINEDAALDSLLKKNLLIFSSSDQNVYFLSELGNSLVDALFKKEIENQSDVESNLYTIYQTIKSFENATNEEIRNFFRHSFYDLLLKLDMKIRTLKESINESKSDVKTALKAGNENSLRNFLEHLNKIKDIIKEMSSALSRYSSYNQILHLLNQLDKKTENDPETSEVIYRASRKLFSIKNELEIMLVDITEFIHRHISLFTLKINISALDKILQFQQKLLQYFGKKGIYLLKPSRSKPPEFRYNWQSHKRKDVFIDLENKVFTEQIDRYEQEEVEKIIGDIQTALSDGQELDYLSFIKRYPLVLGNMPKYYNLILSKLSELCIIVVLDDEIEHENVFYSHIKLYKKELTHHERKESFKNT